MNTAQHIMNIILKSMFDNIFENSYTQEESELIQRIVQMERSVYIDHTRTGQSILCWKSSSRHIVACPLDDQGFGFSGVQLYKPGMFEMRGLVSEKLSQSEVAFVDEEINIFKTIFRAYSIDAERYFK